MARLEASVERESTIDAQRADVWDVVSDVSRLDELMPDVEDYQHTDGGWRWRLKGRRVVGMEVRPAFTVTYELSEPETLVFAHADTSSNGTDADGRLVLREEGGSATHATLRFSLALDTPIPSLLQGRARAILVSEIQRLADGFLANLKARVEG